MPSSVIVEPRNYRDFGKNERFQTFRVVVEQTDLYVRAGVVAKEQAERLVRSCRREVEQAIARRSEFASSMTPIEEDEFDGPTVLRMIGAARKAGTGPMAAVAGAIAERVGRELLTVSDELIVENGGDIFVKVDTPVVVGLYAGKSPFSNRIGIKAQPGLPLGICTSSRTVGPSLSLGAADAATVVSRDTALADAVATALGNRINGHADLKRAVEWAVSVPGVESAVAIIGEKLALQGDLELVRLDEPETR